MAGELYVVATPIGNLRDMVPRAVDVLHAVDLIAAEDTRHSGRLLKHLGIDTPMVPYHDHGEEHQSERILQVLGQGQRVALISDAGTPLISDPGYRLVRKARQLGVKIVPIPGPCALIAALCASGLPSDRFSFEGFLPAKSGARQKKLSALADDPRTLVFYESPHRVLDTLSDMVAELGADREAVLARELTKAFETFLVGSLEELCQMVEEDANQQRGEIVILVSGAPEIAVSESEQRRVLALLMEELPLKQAAALAAKITGGHKNSLYQLALSLKG